MAGFVVVLFLGLCAVLLVAAFMAGGTSPDPADKEADWAAIQSRARAFAEQAAPDWPVMHIDSGDPVRGFLMMSADRRRLRYATVCLRPETLVSTDRVVDLATVISVEMQQTSQTVMKLETTTQTRKSGALGRAAVGGVLLGGVGAVVGAASAGSTSTGTTKGTSTTVLGPAYLVVGTTDMDDPVLKVRMNSAEEGEKWLHRIRASLLMMQAET